MARDNPEGIGYRDWKTLVDKVFQKTTKIFKEEENLSKKLNKTKKMLQLIARSTKVPLYSQNTV